MHNRIVNFIRLLRESNIRISIAESIESCKALKICDITNKQQFKLSLQATLIKQKQDIDVFNKIFDLYFAEPIEKENFELSEEEFESLIDELKQQMDNGIFNDINENSELENSKPQSFDEQYEKYDKLEQQKDLYKQGSESELRQVAQDIANSRNFEPQESENIDNTCDRMLIKEGLGYAKAVAKSETRKSKQDHIEEQYDKLKDFLKEEIEKAMVKQFGESIITDIIEHNNIMDKDLSDLSIDELQRINEIIKKISKKIATHISRKQKNAKRGKIDLKRTIRSSLKQGNIASELKFKNNKKTKSELVVLCDISGSVWMYVSFMLQLVIGVQCGFDKVTSYVFIDTIRNVTDEILKSDNIKNTIKMFLNDRSLGFGTDYGNVFSIFSNEKDIFNKKTILLILGDAENTGKENGEEYLNVITQQCKKTYWLNPNDFNEWYNYSDLDIYEKYCDGIYECKTLRQLDDFIKRLIKI